MNPLQVLLEDAGNNKVALELLEKHITDETKEAAEVIRKVKAKYETQRVRLSTSVNEARKKLQEAIDNGQIPELGVETDRWKLVQVERKNPMLEDFNAVPDGFLLPVAQWIDWKKVDDHVKEHGVAPAGFGLVKSQSPRVMANQKVKV